MYTGSVFHDKRIQREGHHGEFRWWSSSGSLDMIFLSFILREPGDGSTLLQKTHHNSLVVLYVTQILRYSAFLQVRQPKVTQTLLWRMRHIKFFGGRGVVIVRNPYKALISYWNHQVSDFFKMNAIVENPLIDSIT